MKTFVAVLVTMLCAASSSAQTLQKLGPGESLRFTWPAAVVAPDTLDAPDGYRVKAVSPTQTGAVVRSWDVAGATTTTWTMTAAQVPAGVFNITVHPYNAAGEAAGSNPVGPFGKVTTPKSLTGVVGSVVAGGSASLARPESGAVPATWTRSSTPSITATSVVVSGLSFDSRTGDLAWSKSSSLPEMPSDSVSPTSFLRAKPIRSQSMRVSR